MSATAFAEVAGPEAAPVGMHEAAAAHEAAPVARLRAMAASGGHDASAVARLCASAPEFHDELFGVIHATPGWGNAFAEEVLGHMRAAVPAVSPAAADAAANAGADAEMADDEIPWWAVNEIIATDPGARAEYDAIAAEHQLDVEQDQEHDQAQDQAHDEEKADKSPGAGAKLKPFAGEWNVHYKGVNVGKIVRNTYEPYKDAKNSGLTIDLDFKVAGNAKATKAMADFTEVRWVQVIYTNDASSSKVAGKAARYVDPETPDEKTTDDVKPFYHTDTEEKDNEKAAADGFSTNFWDQPSRPRTDATPKTPKVWWNAELALTGVKASGELVYLRSLEYGFDIDYGKTGATLKRNALRGRKKPSKEFKQTVKAFIKKHKGTKGTKP